MKTETESTTSDTPATAATAAQIAEEMDSVSREPESEAGGEPDAGSVAESSGGTSDAVAGNETDAGTEDDVPEGGVKAGDIKGLPESAQRAVNDRIGKAVKRQKEAEARASEAEARADAAAVEALRTFKLPADYLNKGEAETLTRYERLQGQLDMLDEHPTYEDEKTSWTEAESRVWKRQIERELRTLAPKAESLREERTKQFLADAAAGRKLRLAAAAGGGARATPAS
jgi:hypothetical protein